MKDQMNFILTVYLIINNFIINFLFSQEIVLSFNLQFHYYYYKLFTFKPIFILN